MPATNGRRHRAPPPRAAPWPHSGLPAPAESTMVAPVPDYDGPEVVPADASNVFWLELPPTLAPYVRLGMRYHDGNGSLFSASCVTLPTLTDTPKFRQGRLRCSSLPKPSWTSAASLTTTPTA